MRGNFMMPMQRMLMSMSSRNRNFCVGVKIDILEISSNSIRALVSCYTRRTVMVVLIWKEFPWNCSLPSGKLIDCRDPTRRSVTTSPTERDPTLAGLPQQASFYSQPPINYALASGYSQPTYFPRQSSLPSDHPQSSYSPLQSNYPQLSYYPLPSDYPPQSDYPQS